MRHYEKSCVYFRSAFTIKVRTKGNILSRSSKITLAIASISVLGVLVITLQNNLSRKPVPNFALSGNSWDLTSIEHAIGVSLPKDAQNVHYDGHQGRNGFLDLSFEASHNNVNDFTDKLCDGIFYEGYDPFNALDLGEPFTFAHLINVGQFPYYSYSLNFPRTTSGNRCQFSTGSVYQIRIDSADANTHKVRIHVFFSCEICLNISPSSVTPMTEFPVQLLGLQTETEGYSLPLGELCFGLKLSTLYLRDKWKELDKATLKVGLDNGLVFSAIINNGELLSRQDAMGNSIETHQSGNQENYCFPTNLEAGSHTLFVDMTTLAGEKRQYSWDFQLIKHESSNSSKAPTI